MGSLLPGPRSRGEMYGGPSRVTIDLTDYFLSYVPWSENEISSPGPEVLDQKRYTGIGGYSAHHRLVCCSARE